MARISSPLKDLVYQTCNLNLASIFRKQDISNYNNCPEGLRTCEVKNKLFVLDRPFRPRRFMIIAGKVASDGSTNLRSASNARRHLWNLYSGLPGWRHLWWPRVFIAVSNIQIDTTFVEWELLQMSWMFGVSKWAEKKTSSPWSLCTAENSARQASLTRSTECQFSFFAAAMGLESVIRSIHSILKWSLSAPWLRVVIRSKSPPQVVCESI